MLNREIRSLGGRISIRWVDAGPRVLDTRPAETHDTTGDRIAQEPEGLKEENLKLVRQVCGFPGHLARREPRKAPWHEVV